LLNGKWEKQKTLSWPC